MSENIVDMVEEAQKKGKFNLIDAVKGRGYPEATVDIFIDASSAMDLEELLDEINQLDPEDEQYPVLTEKADKLAETILNSKLTFHMRGVGQGDVEKITQEANKLYPDADKEENPEWIKYYLSALIAKNIYKVTDVDGNEDTSEFTADDIIELRSVLPIDSWEKLIDTMQKLTLATSYFDKVTDAGFLPKS